MKKSVFIAVLLFPFFSFSQQNSVLSSGNWCKIAVRETGVHKITYADLSSFGISVDEIDPRNISLYGNKDGMLPESFDETPYTDLQQMAIKVVGEDDGVFQPEDYILFYGQAPSVWNYNSTTKHFMFEMNLYSNSTYYFLTIGNEAGRRIALNPGSTGVENKTIDTLVLLLNHENELVNPGKTGKVWLGESFENNTPFSVNFDLSGYTVYENGHYLETTLAASCAEQSDINLSVNNTEIKSIKMIPENDFYTVYRTSVFDTTLVLSGSNLNVKYTYNMPNDSTKGWLDFLDLNLKVAPKFRGSQMGFRSTQNIGVGKISYYYLNDDSPEMLTVWNVSDPLNVEQIELNTEPGKVWYKLENDNLLEFQAFDGESFLTPEFAGQIENQNLHAITPPDFLIITYPDFLAQANQLASFHQTEDGMSTGVFTPEQVYNEFSSGAQDISAIRNFIWYLCNASGGDNKPEYVLFVGDASYDYKNITENNTNFVPTYETFVSVNAVNSFASDMFFSVKDMQETGGERVATGRLPIATTQQADNCLHKIESYVSTESLGAWKNEMVFIGDDMDQGLHEEQANILANTSETNDSVMNITKCYLDFFELVQTESGPRYPEATAEIQEKTDEGTFYFNYTGHGGAEQLAQEKILDKAEVNAWTNSSKLPLWVIASNDVADYSKPELTSLGEEIFLKENAGAITVFSSTGGNFASTNLEFNQKILEKFTDKTLQGNLRFGDLVPQYNSNSNGAKWILLGDPALKINFPEFEVITTKLNDISIEIFTDTVSPGSTITLQGEIVSKTDGSPQPGFNGTIYLKVYAPPYLRSTLGNQGTPVKDFTLQDSILTLGQTVVENGTFEMQVTFPSEYYPDYGNLKLSWYAENGNTDANGFYNGLTYGGAPYAIAENNELLGQIKVYPTLFTDLLYIETPGFENQTMNCRIYSTMGNMVFENTLKNGENISKIELKSLAAGMYILHVQNELGSRNFKVLKR